MYYRQSLGYVKRVTADNDLSKHDQNLLKNVSSTENRSGRSLVWLGHQPATLTTRVQIPVAAPKTKCHFENKVKLASSHTSTSTSTFQEKLL